MQPTHSKPHPRNRIHQTLTHQSHPSASPRSLQFIVRNRQPRCKTTTIAVHGVHTDVCIVTIVPASSVRKSRMAKGLLRFRIGDNHDTIFQLRGVEPVERLATRVPQCVIILHFSRAKHMPAFQQPKAHRLLRRRHRPLARLPGRPCRAPRNRYWRR